MARKQPGPPKPPPSSQLGWQIVRQHPLFLPLSGLAWPVPLSAERLRPPPLGRGGWGAVDADGRLWHDPERPGTPEEWAWVFAYLLLQLGLGHLPVRKPVACWVAAADTVTEQFLWSIKIGRRPADLATPTLSAREAATLAARWAVEGLPPACAALGVAGEGCHDLVGPPADPSSLPPHPSQKPLAERAEDALAAGLSAAIQSALALASGRVISLGGRPVRSAAQRAREWLISSYPLLGALAASMEIIEDPEACRALDISIAAVLPSSSTIYINPHAALSDEESRFVLAHELLHAGLRHDLRQQWREPFLWNVACDYVINGWLLEMQLGSMPQRGILYDPELKGMSAEEVYDRIANDLRKLRKLHTLRGQGLGDVLEVPVAWWRREGCDLDAFYRRALCTGLDTHLSSGRGFLPAAMVQAIRVLAHPPIPWDVELAQWFDRWFQPVERVRTYARPSRRQGSTPDIPRPRYVLREDALAGRTFGVILDTSGSMSVDLLGHALGAIASYAASRDVPAARVIYCDAVPYDEGYVPIESIAQRVRVKGRGGTVLQPAIDLIERASDFPKSGPILVITDGQCDPLRIHREHAFLVPDGARLPFTPRGPVFRVSHK